MEEMFEDGYDLSMFGEEELETLDEVWNTYSPFEAKFLEEMTHREDPWIIARGNCTPGERCENFINENTMKEFYTTANA